jgi:hypothetical protein
LVESVFNSEKNLEWLPLGGCPVKAPPPSVMSESDVNIYDSRADLFEKDGDDWMFTNENNPSQELKKDESVKQTGDTKPDNQIIQMVSRDDKDMKKLIEGDEFDNPDDYFDAVTIDGI